MVIQKFQISLIPMVLISVLIVGQLVGLILLAWYASVHPSWTESLDSFAVLRLGAAMVKDLPLISAIEAKEVLQLDEKEGWVGACQEGTSKRLVIGGQGQPTGIEQYRIFEDGRELRLRRKDKK